MSELPIKALSIKQPWAWLIVNGFKDIENRDWRADNPGLKYRGEFLIHTGITFDGPPEEWGWPDIPQPNHFDMGGIVGIAEIVDVVKESDSPWFFGRYGLVLKNARPLDFRPCVGQLGFFNPNYDLKYVVKPPKKERPVKINPSTIQTPDLFSLTSKDQ